MTSLEGAPIPVTSVVIQGYFVDGDGPTLGIGYSMRIYLLNAAGERLGTLFALGKRNIEANDPDKDDLEYYLFVDLTEEWVVSAASEDGQAPAAVNLTSPAVWNEDAPQRDGVLRVPQPPAAGVAVHAVVGCGAISVVGTHCD